MGGSLGIRARRVQAGVEFRRLRKFQAGLEAENADTYMELGLTLQGAGRLAEAEAAFRRGLAITPTYITGHLSLGSVLLAEGRFDQARQTFELEAPEYGRDAGLAIADHARGRSAQAATELKRFIQDHGSEQPYIVATSYAYSGATDQAFDWLERPIGKGIR